MMFERKEITKEIVKDLRMLAETDRNAALLLAQIYDVSNDIFWYNRAIDLGSIKAVKLLAGKYITGKGVKSDFVVAYDLLLQEIDLQIEKMAEGEKDRIVREYLKVQALQKLFE